VTYSNETPVANGLQATSFRFELGRLPKESLGLEFEIWDLILGPPKMDSKNW